MAVGDEDVDVGESGGVVVVWHVGWLPRSSWSLFVARDGGVMEGKHE